MAIRSGRRGKMNTRRRRNERDNAQAQEPKYVFIL
jgi:hypothetical protein